MAEVKFGVSLGLNFLDRIEEVEALGFDSLWTGGHIFFYGGSTDIVTTMAAYAVKTKRMTIGTAIFLLPLWPAAITAKIFSSLDILTGGRVVLGIGIGGEYPREFEAVGVPVKQRGPRADEAIQVIRKLWTEDRVTFEGRFNQMHDVSLEPKPVQAGGPPIWVSGRSEGAIRRAALLGDGYMPYLFSAERYRDSLSKLYDVAGQANRHLDGFVPSYYMFIYAADNHDEAHRYQAERLSRQYNQPFDQLVDRYAAIGTPEDCIEKIEAFIESGVRHFILVPTCPPEALMDQLKFYAQEVLPRFRHAVPETAR